MDDGSFPDVYADSLNIVSGPYGYALTFTLTEPVLRGEATTQVVTRVRLSPELARDLANALSQAVAGQPAATSAAGKPK